jgi:hypothetical protein
MGMQRVKIFKGLEDQTEALEREINQWIETSGARVLQIEGNVAPQALLDTGPGKQRIFGAESGATRRFAPSDILVFVLYEV